MQDVAANLRQVRARIAQAEERFGRPPGSVILLAVSKGVTTARMRAAIAAGQHRLGESYVQEALPKIAELAPLAPEWHFIGPVQANKTKNIAANFDWVHSVDRPEIARRLNDHCPPDRPILNVCVQINVSGESSKSGTTLAELDRLADTIVSLPRIRLRGLMTIPAPAIDFERQRAPFRHLRHAFEALNARGLALDTLSMGMSDDLEAAIAEGATLVRVGTAIFGARGGSP